MKTFINAFNGIFAAFKTEKNLKVHLIATIIVTALGFYYHLTITEWCIIVMAIGLVFAAEIFNTAIELLADFVEPNHDKKIGLIKDVAAGAVLILAITAFIIALLIFIPKIISA